MGHEENAIVPAGVCLTGVVERRMEDEGMQLIATLARKASQADQSSHYFPLEWKTLIKTHRRSKLRRIKWDLICAGLVETDGYYHPGKKSYGYRLARRLLGADPVRYKLTDKTLIRRIEKNRELLKQEQERLRRPVHERLFAALHQLRIDPAALDIARAMRAPKRYGQVAAVQRILERRHLFNISEKVHRVTNTLSLLTRPLRPYLTLASQPLVELDLRACLPHLLGVIADTRHRHGAVAAFLEREGVTEPAVDASAYLELMAKGELYEEVGRECGVGRDEAKKVFMRDFLVEKHPRKTPCGDFMRREFAGLFRFVKTLNAACYKRADLLLLRMEAWLVIDHIAARLVERCPVVTLHDAIFCGQEHREHAEVTLREVFGELGFELGWRTKNQTIAPGGGRRGRQGSRQGRGGWCGSPINESAFREPKPASLPIPPLWTGPEGGGGLLLPQ